MGDRGEETTTTDKARIPVVCTRTPCSTHPAASRSLGFREALARLCGCPTLWLPGWRWKSQRHHVTQHISVETEADQLSSLIRTKGSPRHAHIESQTCEPSPRVPPRIVRPAPRDVRIEE